MLLFKSTVRARVVHAFNLSIPISVSLRPAWLESSRPVRATQWETLVSKQTHACRTQYGGSHTQSQHWRYQGDQEVVAKPWLHSVFGASIGYMRLCQRRGGIGRRGGGGGGRRAGGKGRKRCCPSCHLTPSHSDNQSY